MMTNPAARLWLPKPAPKKPVTRPRRVSPKRAAVLFRAMFKTIERL